jgi:hypothetical protein
MHSSENGKSEMEEQERLLQTRAEKIREAKIGQWN